MPNLYLETAEPGPAAPPLEGDRSADVVVVGGGFTGLSTALHLAEKGVRVALLETETPGWGASGRNGGQVNPGLKHDPDVVERDHGRDLGGRMNALAGGAPGFVFELIKRHAIACDARQQGTLRAASTAEQVARVRATALQWTRRAAPVEYLDRAAVARATGTDHYAGAMLDRRGGDVHPLKYARGLARAALAAGAAVHGGSRVVALERSGSAWRVRTPRGSVAAAHVVLATNGYTDDLWSGLRRTLVPLYGAIAATAELPAATAAAIMPGRAVLYESGAITVYYRVDTGGRLLFGGRGPMREITSTGPVAHLLAYARALWPSLADVPWTHAWGGRLAMTRDQYPHVHEPARGILVCLGYNGRGIALASAMGAQLARRIVEPSAAFDMPITDIKTIGLHALWPIAVRAAILKGRLSDFLGR